MGLRKGVRSATSEGLSSGAGSTGGVDKVVSSVDSAGAESWASELFCRAISLSASGL